MSAPQFTPGPWLMGPSESPGPRRVILGPPIPGKPFQAAVIAHVYSGIADDRLIAAAPELYDALAALHLQALQSTVNEPSNEWGREALDFAKAALAKARGDA